MNSLRAEFRKWWTPVTIMFIPHSRFTSLRIKMPFLALASIVLFAAVGVCYTAALSCRVVDYYHTKKKLAYLSGQFQEMQATMSALKESESEFKRLFSFKSKNQVLDAMDQENGGSIDVEELKKQVDATMASVTEIKHYLSIQKDIYRITPTGWPVDGHITSRFGMREHPKYHIQKFHSGVDLSVPQGTDVHATADGIVSYSSWSPGNGNIVVIEHGQGLSTIYAHNSKNLVRVGQTVKRGDVIAAAGATGVATGSHVHYEIWRDGRHVDPEKFSNKG